MAGTIGGATGGLAGVAARAQVEVDRVAATPARRDPRVDRVAHRGTVGEALGGERRALDGAAGEEPPARGVDRRFPPRRRRNQASFAVRARRRQPGANASGGYADQPDPLMAVVDPDARPNRLYTFEHEGARSCFGGEE